jgi:hypothetical protein
MTILNIANDGYYNVLIALYRTVFSERKIDKKHLINLCSDQSDDSRLKVQQTLTSWLQLGLFVEAGDQLSIAEKSRKTIGKSKDLKLATRKLPCILRQIIFSKENNDKFWDRKNSRTADLTRGLAWLMAQDIYAFDLGSHPKVQEKEFGQVKDKERQLVQNDVRWNGLRTWASYLGFLWNSKQVMIDPTTALREDLPLIFKNKTELSSDEFLKSIASVIPVLDGGEYRQKVEGILDQSTWRKPEKRELLSTSLSRALWRLDEALLIRLDERADVGSTRILQRSGGIEFKSFTHVHWMEAKN